MEPLPTDLRAQALTVIAAQYEAFRERGVREPYGLQTTLWTLDDIIADAADPDYAQPDQRRLRDLTTMRALVEMLRDTLGDVLYPSEAR